MPRSLFIAAAYALLAGSSMAFLPPGRDSRFPHLTQTTKIVKSQKATVKTVSLETDEDYEEYLLQKELFFNFRDKQALRSALANAGVFKDEDPLKLEQIVFRCSSVIQEFSQGQPVYSVGDDPGALFFVRSGEFECDSPEDGGSPTVFKAGEYFGGLALISGKAEVEARAIGEGTNSVWRIDRAVYEQIFPRLTLSKNLKERIVSGTGRTAPYVQQALNFLTIKQYLNQSYAFNGTLSDESLNYISGSIVLRSFDKNETVIQKGDIGESLYLVKSGTFRISDGKRVIMTLQSGRLFGEFGAFIEQERPFTVTALSSDCEVWEIPGPAVKVLMGDIKASTYLQMLKDKYPGRTPISALRKLIWEKPGTLLALAKAASTPQRKKVSRHSTLSGIAVGSSLLALIPHWNPKFTNGFIQFFSLAIDNPFHLAQLNVSNALLIIVMLMGQLRFPITTLESRRVLFNTLSVGMLTNFCMGISNLMGTGAPYLIDAWSWPGRILLGGSALMCGFGIAWLYRDILKGPEAGRDANPFFETRKRGLLFATVYNLSFFIQVAHLFPMLDSREKFQSFTAPLMLGCGASSGVLTYAKFINNFYLSMGALYATFQYEKRIKISTSNVILGATAILLLTDLYSFIFRFLWNVNQGVHPFSTLFSYTAGLQNKYKLHLWWFVPMIVAIIQGGITAFRQKPYHTKTS